MTGKLVDELDDAIEGTMFTWRMALTQGKTGIIAVPSPQQFENIVKQAHALMPVFRLLGGFTVTSWLRTPEHNAAVKGAPKSAHLQGLATDFVPTHVTVPEAKKRIKDAAIYPGGSEINTTTWIHLDLVHKHDFIA